MRDHTNRLFLNLPPLFRHWTWAGIDPDSLNNISPVKITNLIALLCSLTLLAQLPLNLFFWSGGGKNHVLISLFHALALTIIPWLNSRQCFSLARFSLTSIYCSYLLSCSLNLQFHGDLHLFLLLGLFIAPFKYDENEQCHARLNMLVLLLAFVVWEFYTIPHYRITIANQHQQAMAMSNSLSFALACGFSAYFIQANMNRGWHRIAGEQQRSEKLLINILPSKIAARLKRSSRPVADHFEQATIVFADIEGFTDLTRKRSAPELVRFLNAVFSEFDRLVKEHGLEKIKTIGDEYMAVSGVPERNDSHAQRACQCALAMQAAYQRIAKRYHINNGLKIGINSGAVVAGVIGKDKFSYDLWGDAVNLASRMESHGMSQKIQVSEHTYNLVAHQCAFEPRGKVNVKGLGLLNSYWLLDTCTPTP